jgi:hypothetical protein
MAGRQITTTTSSLFVLFVGSDARIWGGGARLDAVREDPARVGEQAALALATRGLQTRVDGFESAGFLPAIEIGH